MDKLAPALREDLTRYLLATSAERARIIAELGEGGKVGMMSLLMDLEADDDLRARLEVALLNRDE